LDTALVWFHLIVPSPVLHAGVVAFHALSLKEILVLAGISVNATKAIFFVASVLTAKIAMSPAVKAKI